MVGLRNTSASPDETENITVPTTNPKYAICGKNVGTRAYTRSPADVISGIILAIIFMLKYFEKKVKIRSIDNWVKKFISTSVPRRVQDMPYISWNVTNRMGGRLKIVDMVRYVE